MLKTRLLRPSLILLTASFVGLPVSAGAQDADSDGVADSFDAYPCDATASAVAYIPGEGQRGQLFFEDQWPGQGDLDFDDVVLGYHYRLALNATGGVVGVQARFDVRALGGVFDNGLGLHLPALASAVASVTRSVGGSLPQPILLSSADAEVTVVLSQNLRELFAGAPDQINSLPGSTLVAGQSVVVEIRFSSPVSFSLGQAPFDVYLFRSNDVGHEIHRTPYHGTAGMKTGLFNTQDDGTNVDRAFVDFTGLPFVLDVPDTTVYPAEATPISQLFTDITTFASSGGSTARDYYETNISLAAAYSDANGQFGLTLPGIDDSTDASCLLFSIAAPGLGLWLRADDLAALGQGAAVSQWVDASTGANNASQANAATQPTVQLNQINGHATVRFDGSNDRLDLSTNLFANSQYPLSVFIVLQSPDSSAHIIGTGSSSAGYLTSYGGGVTIVGGRPTLKANSASSGLHLTSSAAANDNQPKVIAGVAGAGGSSLFLDGVLVAEGGANPNAYGYSKSAIGASDGSNSNGSQDPFGGDIAEIIVYQRTLLTSERVQVEQYLGAKYGIAMTLEAGCDGVPGSAATVDDCNVCGGDNTTCGAHLVPQAGRKLWLRAGDIAASDGSQVSIWRDFSSFSNDAGQTSAALRPVYRSPGINGQPAVEFDGSNDRLDLTTNSFAPSAYPLTVCAVLSTTDASAHVIGTGSSSAGYLTSYGGSLVVYGGSATLKANAASSGLFLSGQTAINDGQARVICGISETGMSRVLTNGVVDGTSGSSANANGYSKSTIGSSDGSNSNQTRDPFAGQIAEIMVFDRGLSDVELESVESYLATKYSISVTLPPGCDGVAGSRAIIDGCGVCGGDGSTCGANVVIAEGLQLWLRAQSLATLLDGDAVTSWGDISGKGRVAAQPTGTRAPVYRAGAFGGLGGVEFDGTDDRLDIDANIFAPSTYPQTTFMVLRTTDTSAHLLGTGSSSNGYLTSYGGGMTISAGSPTIKANSGSSGLHLSATGGFADGQIRILSGVSRAGASTIYVDCVAAGISSASTNATAYSKSTIGASDGSASGASIDPFAGEIAEVIVYHRVLPDVSRQAIQAHLAAKYGVTNCISTEPSAEATLAGSAAAFWRMDEAGTGARSDVTGALPVLPYPPNAVGTTQVAAIVGNGQLVDGPSGYHYYRSSAAGLNHGGGSFTWAGWVRFDSNYDDQTVVGKWNLQPAAGREYLIWYNVSTGRVEFKVSGNGLATDVATVVHPEPVVFGTYYFVEAWHDAEQGRINLRVGTQTQRGAVAVAPWTSGVYFGSSDLNIAAHNTCATAHLDGVIDALGFWRRTLTAEESVILWNNGAGWEP